MKKSFKSFIVSVGLVLLIPLSGQCDEARLIIVDRLVEFKDLDAGEGRRYYEIVRENGFLRDDGTFEVNATDAYFTYSDDPEVNGFVEFWTWGANKFITRNAVDAISTPGIVVVEEFTPTGWFNSSETWYSVALESEVTHYSQGSLGGITVDVRKIFKKLTKAQKTDFVNRVERHFNRLEKQLSEWIKDSKDSLRQLEEYYREQLNAVAPFESEAPPDVKIAIKELKKALKELQRAQRAIKDLENAGSEIRKARKALRKALKELE